MTVHFLDCFLGEGAVLGGSADEDMRFKGADDCSEVCGIKGGSWRGEVGALAVRDVFRSFCEEAEAVDEPDVFASVFVGEAFSDKMVGDLFCDADTCGASAIDKDTGIGDICV